MSTKKWLIAFFKTDSTYVPLDHRSLFVTGKLKFIGADGKKLKILYQDQWYEGEVKEQWGKCTNNVIYTSSKKEVRV